MLFARFWTQALYCVSEQTSEKPETVVRPPPYPPPPPQHTFSVSVLEPSELLIGHYSHVMNLYEIFSSLTEIVNGVILLQFLWILFFPSPLLFLLRCSNAKLTTAVSLP